MPARKPGWMYLEREFNSNLAQVNKLVSYVRDHNVKFFLKDAKWMAQQAYEAKPFRASDLPETVSDEHREPITELLNLIVRHYDRERQKREKHRQKIEDARQPIPEGEQRHLFYIRDHYGPWLRSDDKRQARLDSFTSINRWLNMNDAEREQWFERVEAYVQPLKKADDDRKFESRWRKHQEEQRRKQEYRKFNQNRGYYMSVLSAEHKRRQAYGTLGLPVNANAQDVKKSWKALVLAHHPDQGGDQKRFIEINDAYHLISDKTN